MSKTSNHAKLACLKDWQKTLKPQPKKRPVVQQWDIEEDEYATPTRYTRIISKHSR